MKGSSHRVVGAAAGLMAAALQGTVNPLLLTTAIFVGSVGGTAPDWLEIPYWNNRRLIKHRTLTHWVPLWLLAIGVVLHSEYAEAPLISTALFAFLAGGLSHLVMDWPNPAGVPFIWPTKRHSLNWWKSGDNDYSLMSLSWVLALISVAYCWNTTAQ